MVSLGLIASVAVPAIATLAPFRLKVPAAFCLDIALRTSDVLLNLALLAPLGFVLGMRARCAGKNASLSDMLAAGAGLSMLLELLQLFVPMRCSSPIDVVANALGCGLGAVLHAQLAVPAERELHAFLRRAPSAAFVSMLAALLGALALSPLDARLMHATFRWTTGATPLTYDPQSIVIGLIASLGLAAWLGFTLRMRARSALPPTACALLIVTAIEVCRGYNMRHQASLMTLALAALCAVVSAHVAGRISQSQSAARRIWV